MPVFACVCVRTCECVCVYVPVRVCRQASLLVSNEGSEEAAELFCASRLGREGTWNFGAVAPSNDPSADLARANRIVHRFLSPA